MSQPFGTYRPSQKTKVGTDGARRPSQLSPRTTDTPSLPGAPTGASGTQATAPVTDAPGKLAASTIKTRPSFATTARTPPTETGTDVARRCERLFADGQAPEAIRQLDAALLKIQDPAAQHHLLEQLEQALVDLIDHRQPGLVLTPGLDDCLSSCQGIGQAICRLQKAGWWLPTQSGFLDPRVREVLIALSDPTSVFEVVTRQVALQLADAKGLVDLDDFNLVLDRLEHVLRLASKPVNGPWLAQVLEHAQQSFQRLAERTDDACAPLKARYLGLIQACLAPAYLQTVYPTHSRVQLKAKVNEATGQWTWQSIEYPPINRFSHDEMRREQIRLFGDIENLLQGPQPAPWALILKLVSKVKGKFGWVPSARTWLGWSLREVAHGNAKPLMRQLQKIENEEGRDAARTQWFSCLQDRLKAGMPWSEKTELAEAVFDECRWRLSPKDEWSLHLLCAQGGDAQPMIELLTSQLPLGFIDRARLEALLKLCGAPSLPAQARINLIAAIRPHLVNAPELGSPFDALLRSFQWRASVRTRPSVQDTSAPITADDLVRQARKTMEPWFTIDTRHAQGVTVHTSHDKAPATPETQEQFEATLITWMNVELLQESMNWQALSDCIDKIEHLWNQTIDRGLLLDLCIQHVERTGNPKALQDHLPKLIDTHPTDQTLHRLLAIASRADGNPAIRATLIPRLLAWARPRTDATLHGACVQAVLSLPAGDIRAAAINRFVLAYNGDEAMQKLFGIVARQHDENARNPLLALRVAPPPPADPGAWLGWRTLCRALFDGIVQPLSFALAPEQNPGKAANRLLDALSTLATPASGDMTLAIPQLFDLLGDLAQSVPQDQRTVFLERLHALSLLWPGAPVLQAVVRGALQAVVRGALQALLAHERGNAASLPLSANTNQLVIDEATVLFTHGFLYRMALQRGEDESAKASLHELKLRWDRSGLRTHAHDMATLVARLFNLQNPQ